MSTSKYVKARIVLAAAAIAACSCAVTAVAEEITLEQAETAVGNWIAKGGGFGKLAGGGMASGRTLEDPDTGTKMHLVRVPGKGFVVTSADDGIEPIVLFSDGGDGDLVAEEGNPAWDLLRWDLAARAAALKEGDNGGSLLRLQSANGTGSGGQTSVSPKEKWASLLPERNSGNSLRLMAASSSCVFNISDVRVSPFIHTEWGQTSVDGQPAYNYYTPGKIKVNEVQTSSVDVRASDVYVTVETNEVHYPCGCAATAGAQIMYKWKYPSSPKSIKTETCKRDGEDLVLTMKGGPYKWTSMGGARPHTESERKEVGRVTFDIGVACGAKYAEKGTSINFYMLVEKLRTVFGYESAKYYDGSMLLSNLKRISIPSLEARAPILLFIARSKTDNSINHAVVADGYGYDNGDCYLHVNFGWNGTANAWYVPPDLNTGTHDYSVIRAFGYNIFPNGSGSLVSGHATGANGRALAGATVELCSTSGSVLSTAKTEKNGSYWFQQGPGTYNIRVRLGSETTSASITLAECDDETIGNELKDWTITSAPSVSDVSVITSSANSGAKGSADSSIISSPISVRLSCATANAEIHYTLDGTQPIPESPVFDGAITIQDTTTLRAVAYADGMECSETFEQTWTFVDPVSRDNFANARLIDGTRGHASFNNTGYTKESGEPVHSKNGTSGGTSAWAVWTAPESGDWTFYLSGVITNINEAMDTQLAVYTGTAVNALTRVVANDDVNATEGDCSSRVSFSAAKGMTYYIAMDSYRGTTYPGTLALRWEEGFVHYAQFDHPSHFLPSPGGHVEIGVESSAAWSFVECSDWITPRVATGESGGAFVFDAMSNTTGSERSGYVTIQADNSDFATLSIRQHVMDFVTTKDGAVEAAWRTNKRILLVRGRETCGNTIATLFYSIPSSTVKPLLDAGYVLWYSNCDRQTDASRYSAGGALPTVAILDPSDMAASVAGVSGYQSASALKSLLDANSSWGGLPSPTGVELAGVRAVVAETPYSMNVTFADGTVVNLKHGVTWTITSGSAATITNDGVLVPVAGRVGTVTVSGSVVLRGQTYTRTMDVRVINPAAVTGVSVAGPEVIDLYDVSSGRFTATVTCSDGTTAVVSPQWTIEETSVTNAVISAEGLVTFPNPEKYNKASRLRVTAKCNGVVASKEADVWGWNVSLSSWTTPQRAVWPGQTAKIVPHTVTWWRHGVTEAPTTDFNGVDFSISYGYVNGSTYVGPTNAASAADGLALRIPSDTSEPEGYCYVYVKTSATRLGQTITKGSWPYFKYLPSAPSQTVAVTFVADGGEPETQTSKYAVGYTYGYLPEAIRTGYYCYWYTAAEGGTQITTTSNCLASVTRLYAHWSPRSYYITYNANGGEGSMSRSWFNYDRPANLRANSFTKAGATFAGWATSANGPVIYQDGAEILNLSSVYTEITLYAVWDANRYKVTLGKNGGTGGDNYVTATYGKPMPTPRTAPTQSGWTFAGYWDSVALDANGNPKGKQYYDGSMKSVRNWDKKAATTLWAKWTNKVTLGKNGGTGGDNYVTCTKGQPMPKRTMPTKSGYVFDGYWTTTGAGGVKYYNADGTSAHVWDKSGNVTLWAKWVKPVACKVTLGKNGGTGGDDYVTATTGKAMPTPRTAPKRTGWTFGGYWDTLACDASGNPLGKQYYDASMKSVRNWDKTSAATLWAKWTVRVKLGKNGGTGGDDYVTVVYNQPFPKRTMPKRSGYAFGGYWVSASSKTGQCYNPDGTGTSSMKWSTGGSPTIWALWTKTSACVELPPAVAPSASAAPAPAEPAIPAGIYSGILADGTGAFWLVLDEAEKNAPRTAFLYVSSEDGSLTAECTAEEVDGILLLMTDGGGKYVVDIAAGIAICP